MNARIRAKRILEPLRGFRYIENENEGPAGEGPAGACTRTLGGIIGCYDNVREENGRIWIYEDGLVWCTENERQSIHFDEIVQVFSRGEKRSVEIKLIKNNGQVLVWPFDGNDGTHFESLEMLRFLDRVMSDRRQP